MEEVVTLPELEVVNCPVVIGKTNKPVVCSPEINIITNTLSFFLKRPVSAEVDRNRGDVVAEELLGRDSMVIMVLLKIGESWQVRQSCKPVEIFCGHWELSNG